MSIDIAAIRQRLNGVTAGPWFPIDPADEATEWFDPYDSHMVVTADSSPGNYCAIAQEITSGARDGGANAEFIAHARTDVPALCDEVQRFKPVALPDGSQLFIHTCHHTEWWNEDQFGPINDEAGCDACESAPYSGGWQPIYVRKAAGR